MPEAMEQVLAGAFRFAFSFVLSLRPRKNICLAGVLCIHTSKYVCVSPLVLNSFVCVIPVSSSFLSAFVRVLL